MATETEIASLLVRLGADIEQYSRAFEKAQRDADTRVGGIDKAIKRAEDAFGRMGKSVGKVNTAIAALGTGAAIAALTRLGKGALDTAGSLNDLSERLGIGAEKLQAYRYAGSLVGIEQGKIDAALQKFSVNIGKAAQGTGDLADTVQAYGISLRDSSGHLKTTEQLLLEYADVVSRAASQQEKMRLSVAGFGRDGAGFVQLLNNGSAGLKQFETNARAAGVMIDEALIKKGDEVGDKLDTLKQGLTAAFDRGFLRGVTGDFTNIDDALSKIAPKVEAFGKNVAGAFSQAADAAKFLADNMDKLMVIAPALIGLRIGGLPGGIAGLIAGLTAATAKTRELEDAWAEYNRILSSAKTTDELHAQMPRIKELMETIDRLSGVTKKDTAATDENSKSRTANTKATVDGIDADIAAMKKWDEAHKKNVQEMQAFVDKMKEQIKAGDDLIAQQTDEVRILKLLETGNRQEAEVQEILLKVQRQFPAAWAANKEAIEASTRALVNQKEANHQATAEQERAVKVAQEAAEQMRTIWDEAARDIFDTWRDGWRDLLSGKIKDFEDFAKRILNIGLDLAANLIAAQTWNSIVGPGAASGFAGSVAGTSLLSGVGGAAGGGLVSAASLAPWMAPLAGAGLGAFAGAGIGSLVGGDRTGAKVGGAVGGGLGGFGALPFMLAGGNPLIGLGFMALTSVLGGLLGGLFGAHPSDKLQGDWLNFDQGSMTRYGYDGAKFSQENADAANKLGQSLLQFGEVLKSAGLGGFATNARVEAGSRDAPFRVWYAGLNGDTGSGQFQNPQDAFKAMAQEILKNLSEVPAGLQKVIDNIDYSNLDKFAQDLQDALQWTNTLASVRDQLEQIRDPKAFELKSLDAVFDPLKAKARETGEGLADIEELYGIKRQEILSRYAEGAVGAFNLADVWSQMNAAEGRGFLNQIQGAVASHTSGLAAAGTNATGIEWVNRTFTATLKGIISAGGLTADELNVIKATFASIPEVVSAADDALRSLNSTVVDTTISAEEAAQAQTRAWEQVTAAAQEAVNARLDTLADERAAIEDNARLAQAFADSIHSAKLRFLTDKSLYRGTNEQRLNDLLALLDSTNIKAQAGDPQARADLADIAIAAAEANNTFNASSEKGNEIQAKIQAILDSSESLASQELRVAQLALAANQAQVELLRQQLAILSNTARASQGRPAPTAADINALNSAYVSAHNSMVGSGAGQMTEQQWVNSATFGAFQNTLIGNIGASSDTAWLTSTLTGAQARSSDPYLGASGQAVAEAAAQRLHDLGVPGYASGTGAGRTGQVAFVHPDEMIYTGPPARVMSAAQVTGAGDGLSRAVAGLREDVRMLAQTVSLASGDQVAKLGNVVTQLTRMTGNLDTVLATR